MPGSVTAPAGAAVLPVGPDQEQGTPSTSSSKGTGDAAVVVAPKAEELLDKPPPEDEWAEVTYFDIFKQWVHHGVACSDRALKAPCRPGTLWPLPAGQSLPRSQAVTLQAHAKLGANRVGV